MLSRKRKIARLFAEFQLKNEVARLISGSTTGPLVFSFLANRYAGDTEKEEYIRAAEMFALRLKKEAEDAYAKYLKAYHGA